MDNTLQAAEPGELNVNDSIANNLNSINNITTELYDEVRKSTAASIVKRYALLVKKIAYHLMNKLPPSIQEEDLCQAGMIGLLEASKNYDSTKGASFETYAGIRIRGAMLDEIRKIDWAPRSVHRNTRRVMQAIKDIENKKCSGAKNVEVAANLNISLQEYHQILQDTNCSRVVGFGDIGVDEDAIAITAVEYNGGEPLAKIEHSDLKQNLSKEIANLPEKERLVLALYYEEDLNLKEVGKILGVSESRVSQIHSQAMLRLQGSLKSLFSCGKI
jgi:RNA polymerase sigma factor for flagellar operon FliA